MSLLLSPANLKSERLKPLKGSWPESGYFRRLNDRATRRMENLLPALALLSPLAATAQQYSIDWCYTNHTFISVERSNQKRLLGREASRDQSG